MSWWSKVSSSLGDSWDSFSDWFTGASDANRQARYQANLDAANRAFQSKEAEKAFERQKQFFDYQARYNTPAAQMQRLQAAGLNPNLVYGNGAMAVQGSTGPVASAYGGAGGHATGGHGNAGGLAALTGLLGSVLRDVYGAGRDQAEAKFYNAKAVGQEMQNKTQALYGAFGDSWVGKTLRGFVAMRDAFPEQYHWVKDKAERIVDWLTNKSSSSPSPTNGQVNVLRVKPRESVGKHLEYEPNHVYGIPFNAGRWFYK